MIRTHSETELNMVKLYKKGKSMKEIAEIFKISQATVCMHLKKYIPVSERRKRQYKFQKTSEEILEKIRNMHKKGLSSLIIGKKLDISSSTVLYHLKKMNIDTSRGDKYKPKIDTDKLEQIKNLYEENGSILKTAQKLKLHPASIHYRLAKLGIVKKKTLNQKIARKKYNLLTDILVKLFLKMNYKIRYVQKQYNGHGPDMIIENEKESILVEHKATIKRSWYWQHAIEEVNKNLSKYNVTKAIVVTTAKKPKNFKEEKIEIIFFDDLQKLLKENELQYLIPKMEYISNTPSV